MTVKIRDVVYNRVDSSAAVFRSGVRLKAASVVFIGSKFCSLYVITVKRTQNQLQTRLRYSKSYEAVCAYICPIKAY